MYSFDEIEKNVVDECNDVFGKEVTYAYYNASSISIKGVLNSSYVDASGVVINATVLRIAREDLTRDPSVKDNIIMDDVTYKIAEARKDGYGGYSLILMRQA